MKLCSADGASTLGLRVSGYQFPDARDPRKRYSWHMISGSATRDGETWEFRYPALACDESARLSTWLRAVVDWLGNPDGLTPPGRLAFTEPNLALELAPWAEDFIDVELNLEFRAPSDRPSPADGDPTHLHLTANPDELWAEADQWDRGLDVYPDTT